MARRSAPEKAETHARILRHASEAFRLDGTGVGIGDVMKELGLTHGGFYRHFASKDELLGEAVALALDEVASRLQKVAEGAEPGSELSAIIEAYMSKKHQQHPETWCALASLMPEIARLPEQTRRRIDAALLNYRETLLRYMPGRDVAEQSGVFVVLFSGMAGAMAMSRCFSDAATREQVLRMSREYYLATFAKPQKR
jgi:TetR/AcrR family transcriptional repressor of nem operon